MLAKKTGMILKSAAGGILVILWYFCFTIAVDNSSTSRFSESMIGYGFLHTKSQQEPSDIIVKDENADVRICNTELVQGNDNKKNTDFDTMTLHLQSKSWVCLTGPSSNNGKLIKSIMRPGIFTNFFHEGQRVSKVKLCYKWYVIGSKNAGPNIGTFDCSCKVTMPNRKKRSHFIDKDNNDLYFDLTAERGTLDAEGNLPLGPQNVEVKNGREKMVLYLQQAIEIIQSDTSEHIDSGYKNNYSWAMFEHRGKKKRCRD
jgi:hypothetical protein